jgi:hypothetical protein
MAAEPVSPPVSPIAPRDDANGTPRRINKCDGAVDLSHPHA